MRRPAPRPNRAMPSQPKVPVARAPARPAPAAPSRSATPAVPAPAARMALVPARAAAPQAAPVSLTCVPAHCDFDRLDSTSMFNTLGGIRALPSHEASAAIARRTLAEARGYSRFDLMAIAEVGYHYLRSGGDRLAQVIFEGLTAVSPREPYFWLALGLANEHLGELPAARAAYEMTIRLDPKDATPELNLAELDLGAGQRSAARRRLAVGKKKAQQAGQLALANKADAIVQLMAG